MNATFESPAALRDSLQFAGHKDLAYVKKMYQLVPDLPTVPDRAKYLVEKSKDRVVLDIGCTGPISAEIRGVAKGYYGVDSTEGEWETVNLDEHPEQLPEHQDVDLFISSEVLEHLSNPGRFLQSLKAKYPGREGYITVPQAGAYSVKEGKYEIVSADHVAWYSYSTLKTLLTRAGYEILKARWYNGQPHVAEGLIMQVRT